MKFSILISSELYNLGLNVRVPTHMCTIITMVSKETISHYVHQNNRVFCTFLDASKAFDRVNYCKLFRILVERGLPPCVIRILINMYIAQQACVSSTFLGWCHLYSLTKRVIVVPLTYFLPLCVKLCFALNCLHAKVCC